MYNLKNKLLGISFLIASVVSNNTALAVQSEIGNGLNSDFEQLKWLFPTSDRDIDVEKEHIDYTEASSKEGIYEPTFLFNNEKFVLRNFSNTAFASKDNAIQHLNIATETSFNQAALKSITTLRGLVLSSKNINSSTPLTLPSSLEYLKVISPFAELDGKLSNLKYLYISNKTIEKVPCLSTMPNLEYFEATHTGLKVLHLGDIPAPKLSEIRFIYNDQFKDILNITQFKNLEKAFLRGLTPIAPVDISTLTKLNRLILDTPLTDKGIVLPPNLVHLDYTCHNCTQTPDISQLKNLTYARFSGPEFKSLPNILAPEKLEELHLENTGITTIQGLEKFTHLKKLSINASQISKIENLDKLPQLTYLSLSGNKISKIENIKKLVNLDTLNLEENPIATVDFTEFDHLGGALIKLYGTPYDDTMSTDDYRKFSKLARQKRTTEKSQ